MLKSVRDSNIIGYSLSFCVRDIIRGEVRIEDVKNIISNTCARDEGTWFRLTESYCKIYWDEDKVRAREIVDILRKSNRIEQLRLTNPNYVHDTKVRWEVS